MRTLFPSYYPLDESELEALWKNATFVLDTNTLLNLFRIKESSADNILNTLEKIKDRIFIPHHVALELHRNYQSIMCKHRSNFDQVVSKLDAGYASLINSIDSLSIDGRHPIIDSNELKKDIENFKNKQIKKINEKKLDTNFNGHSKKILERLTKILDGKIGEPFNKDSFEQANTEAEKRIKNEIPPGYKDSTKKTFLHNGVEFKGSHGDYFVWKQILNHCSSESIKHLIFVTSDNKEDWWQKESGQTIGPRRELRDEIRTKGKVDHFHMYTEANFLEEIGKIISDSVDKETITDIKSWNKSIKNNYFPIEHTIPKNEIYDLFNRDEISNKDLYDFFNRDEVSSKDLYDFFNRDKVSNKNSYNFFDKKNNINSQPITNKLHKLKKQIEQLENLRNDVTSSILISKQNLAIQFPNTSEIEEWERHQYKVQCKSVEFEMENLSDIKTRLDLLKIQLEILENE
jgi:predicted nucleic acid-binding protein